jgi:hypothetical protein
VNYIPGVNCAKCGKVLTYGKEVRRRMTGQNNSQRRFIQVSCHGETLEVGFVEQPTDGVVLWQEHSADTQLSAPLRFWS